MGVFFHAGYLGTEWTREIWVSRRLGDKKLRCGFFFSIESLLIKCNKFK